MATELTSLIFEVNQLVSRIMRGDLAAAEVLAGKARLLERIVEEAFVGSDHLPSAALQRPQHLTKSPP